MRSYWGHRGFRRLALLGVGLGVFVLGGCENDLSRVNTITSELLEVSVETSRGIRIVYSDSTKVKAVMTSPLLMSYQTEEPYDLMPEGLHVEFYNDSLEIESTLTSKYGRRDLKAKTMEVRDSVVVLTEDGRKLETERLVWEEEGDRIYSDRFVKITDPNGDITQGPGLETNSKFNPMKIMGMTGRRTWSTGSADSTFRGADSASVGVDSARNEPGTQPEN